MGSIKLQQLFIDGNELEFDNAIIIISEGLNMRAQWRLCVAGSSREIGNLFGTNKDSFNITMIDEADIKYVGDGILSDPINGIFDGVNSLNKIVVNSL